MISRVYFERFDEIEDADARETDMKAPVLHITRGGGRINPARGSAFRLAPHPR
jgi:hypothetical protein